jgi:hypothetical protein
VRRILAASAIVLIAAACSSTGSSAGSGKGRLRLSEMIRGHLYVEGAPTSNSCGIAITR